MKTLIESLDATTRKSIQLCVENIENASRSSSKLLEVGIDENTLVISRGNAVELVKKIPLIVAHQTIFRKLKVRPLLDPYEIVHFEERKDWPKDIEKYLKQFRANPLDKTLIFQIATEISKPLKEVSGGSGKFILTGTFISDPALNRTIGLATRDVWGYNTFSGLFYDLKIIDRMTKLDTAFNLKHCKSIVPVRIFSDFVELEDSVAMIQAIDRANENNTAPLLHGVSRKLDELREDLIQVVEKIVETYPHAFEFEWERERLGKTLLNTYTMSPSDMIKEFGPQIICCPFKIPKAFRDSSTSSWWTDSMHYDSFGHHPLAC